MKNGSPDGDRIEGDPDVLVHVCGDVAAVVSQGEAQLVDEKTGLEFFETIIPMVT